MEENPFAPPQAPLGADAPGQLDEAQAAAILARMRKLNRTSLLLAIPGILLQTAAVGMGGMPLFSLVGTALVIAGFAYYAQMKGRSGWWALTAFLSCIGLAILALLPPYCHHCGQKAKGKTCESCGAPARL